VEVLSKGSKGYGAYSVCVIASFSPRQQAEQLCSIGSGAVESAIKQLGKRIKISGAQWQAENVNQILSVRCAYLNGLLTV